MQASEQFFLVQFGLSTFSKKIEILLNVSNCKYCHSSTFRPLASNLLSVYILCYFSVGFLCHILRLVFTSEGVGVGVIIRSV